MTSVPKGTSSSEVRSQLRSARFASATEAEAESLNPDLGFHLERLASLRQTGTLVVLRPRATSTLIFDRGKLALAKGGYGASRLGRILLEAGALTELQLIQALSAQQADRCRAPLGRLLVESDRVEAALVKNALEIQCKRVLNSVLSGAYARYHWMAGSWGDLSHIQESRVPVDISIKDAIRDRLGR